MLGQKRKVEFFSCINLCILIMASEVIKKDGTKEPFDAEKIKNAIATAAQQADLSEERKNEVVEQVADVVIKMTEEKEEIATSEIKEKILSELDSVESGVAEAWRKYEAEKGGAEEETEEGEGEAEETKETKETKETEEPKETEGE